MDKIFILDTTLRDGVQSPLVSFTEKEKLEFAKVLVDLGVDVIDCGYPALSREEEQAVKLLLEQIDGPVLSVLAKPKLEEVEKAVGLLRGKRGRVHIPIPTSEIRLAFLSGMDREQQLKTAIESAKFVKDSELEVEITLEDAFRAEKAYLEEVISKLPLDCVDVVNISDTVGIATPGMVTDLVSFVVDKVKGRALVSIHCHDDLGMATANSFAALEAGARQVHVTIAGVGTRAGNASLEEVVVALKLHGERLGLTCDVDSTRLYRTARMFSKMTGYVIPPHKAVVGDAVFAHKVEYMRLAVVREPKTYEIISPEEVGYPKKRIVLSKRSGIYMFRKKVEELGYSLDEERLNEAFKRFKELAERKSEVYDNDIIAIVEDVVLAYRKKIKLLAYSIKTGSEEDPEAEVVLLIDGQKVRASSKGDGPVDAAFKAVDEATGLSGRLIDYRVNAVTSGKDALGEVFLKVLFKGKEFSGRAVNTDILQASIEAYISAANKAL